LICYRGNEQANKKLVRAGITLVGTDDLHQVPLFAGIESLSPFGEMTGYVDQLSRVPNRVANADLVASLSVILDNYLVQSLLQEHQMLAQFILASYFLKSFLFT
jgi:hypothetical protein